MEYTAKIFQEQWITDKQVWKYNFLNVENNQQDFFYNDKQINYNPHIAGKLSISENKFFQSFEKEINEESKNFDLTETFAEVAGKVGWGTKKFLNDLPKKYRKVSIEPEHLQNLRELGFSHKEISKVYKRCERTIYRWFKPSETPLQKRGVKPKVSEEVINLVRDYALENKIKTQQEMADYVYQKLGVRISRPSINALLKRLGITYKKLTYHYTQLDEAKAKAFNEEIKPLLAKHPFIALDECSFYPKLDPRFGYSLKGARAVSRRPNNKGEHYTLFFCIKSAKEKGVVSLKLTKEKIDFKVFYDFLESINLTSDEKHYLLLDNSRIHSASNKRKDADLPSIEEQLARKNIVPKFITPYAPMLNPTELVFNLLRQQTEKRRPRTYEELKLAIEKVVELLNKQDLRKYFWHCATYFDNKEAKNKSWITDI